MSIVIYMMAAPVDPALAKRLETLTGADAACCVTDLRALAGGVHAASAFQHALARLKAAADEKRLLALALLKRRSDTCSCELQAALDVTHATVSHHMAVLVEAGLVTAERRGKWVHYALTDAGRAIAP